MGNEQAVAKEIDDVLEGMGIQAAPETPPEPPAETPAETPAVEDVVGDPETPVEAVTPPQETPTPGEPPPAESAVPPASPPATPPETPAAPVEEDEITRLKRENEEFRNQLLAQARDAITPKPVAPPAGQPAPETRRGPSILPFFKEDKDIDAAFKDVESANTFMTKVVSTAVEFVARNMPAAIERIAEQQISTRMAIKEFYDNNKDLEPYKEYCGYITNKVVAENPNINLGDLLEKVAVESRKALKLAVQAGEPIIPAGVPPGNDNVGGAGRGPARKGPALPPVAGGGRKSGPPPLSGLEKEIADIIDLA